MFICPLKIEQEWPQVDLFSSVQISHSVMPNSALASQHMTGLPVHHQLLSLRYFVSFMKKNSHFLFMRIKDKVSEAGPFLLVGT